MDSCNWAMRQSMFNQLVVAKFVVVVVVVVVCWMGWVSTVINVNGGVTSSSITVDRKSQP